MKRLNTPNGAKPRRLTAALKAHGKTPGRAANERARRRVVPNRLAMRTGQLSDLRHHVLDSQALLMRD
jgi:hypothetical protein